MKIKILRGDRGKWYHITDNVGREFCVIGYYENSPLRFAVGDGGGYWVDKDDCVITELPGDFCVKRCDDKEKWNKYVNWLKKKYYRVITDSGEYTYYGRKNTMDSIGSSMPFGIEIYIDDIIKHIDFYSEPMVVESEEEKKMEIQKLSRQGLKEIHSVACSNWKAVLEKYGANSPLEDYIELTREQVNNMFKACTKEQLPIVSKYLKQDDGSVDIMKFKCEIYDADGRAVIEKRFDGEYAHKSLLLDEEYAWEIKQDSKGYLCLIPTKKK